MKKKPIIKTFLIGCGIIGVVFFLLPRIRPLGLEHYPSSTLVYDRHGDEIAQIPGTSPSGNVYKFRPLSYQEIPPFLIDTLIAIEDQRFRRHHGIDARGILRATWHNIQQRSIVEGASTISSQTIKNYYRPTKPRTVSRKLSEFYLARALHFQYTREEILTMYCNRIHFGGIVYGFKSASQWYFGKALEDLTPAEQFALIVMAKNASTYNPFDHPQAFGQRRQNLAQSLVQRGVRDSSTAHKILSESLLRTTDRKEDYPYLKDYFKQNLPSSHSGKNIHSTIDKYLTKEIRHIATQTLQDLQRKNVGDFGILIIDRHSKEIRVMIGGSDYYSKNGQVNSVFAYNQAGSTMKPFTYLYAFLTENLTPQDTIIDAPVQFQNNLGFSYAPKNFSLDYKGEVTLAQALASSLNIPAIKLAKRVGIKNLLTFYRRLGFEGLTQDADHYGLALTLGVGQVNLYELTKAFGLFAWKQYCEPTIFQNQPANCQQSFLSGLAMEFLPSEETLLRGIGYIEDILSDRYAKLYGFPINSNLDFADRFVVKKSGTSRNFSDNRVIGYTDNFLIGVRVGNKDGSSMKGVVGSEGAGKIFGNIVRYLCPPQEQNNILGMKSGGTGGTSHNEETLIITSPLDHSVFQQDPTIPLTQQKIKLTFFTTLSYDHAQRYINGQQYNKTFFPVEETGVFDLEIKLFSSQNTMLQSARHSIKVIE